MKEKSSSKKQLIFAGHELVFCEYSPMRFMEKNKYSWLDLKMHDDYSPLEISMSLKCATGPKYLIKTPQNSGFVLQNNLFKWTLKPIC